MEKRFSPRGIGQVDTDRTQAETFESLQFGCQVRHLKVRWWGPSPRRSRNRARKSLRSRFQGSNNSIVMPLVRSPILICIARNPAASPPETRVPPRSEISTSRAAPRPGRPGPHGRDHTVGSAPPSGRFRKGNETELIAVRVGHVENNVGDNPDPGAFHLISAQEVPCQIVTFCRQWQRQIRRSSLPWRPPSTWQNRR